MSHHASARLTLILGLALALTCSIAAADGSAGAAALVREQVSRGLETVVRDTETIASDREHARAILERLYVPHADIEGIARFIAGPHWGDSEAETRTRFTKAFAEHLLRLYATAVSEYADEVAEFARHGEVEYRTVREANGRAVVRLLLQDRSGRSLSVDLMLHRDNGGWQVYDARVLGISLLRTYRASLRPRLAEVGLDGLSQELESRCGPARGKPGPPGPHEPVPESRNDTCPPTQ